MSAGLSGARIASGRVSALRIPTEKPESDGTATWDSTTVVLVELTAEDVTGLGFSYANVAAVHATHELAQRIVLGCDAFDIPSIHSALDIEVRNWGRPGLVSTAISALDNCLWDLKARLLEQPLWDLLGKARDKIPAYGSGGFTSYTERELVDQLTGWASEGLQAVKMKIGREPDQDFQRVAAVQKALNGRSELYVDANGAYQRKQALGKAQQFGDIGVTWFEEPVSSDDREGLRLLVQYAPPGMNIAAGEYCYVLDDARLLVDSKAVDVLQADATRCGGITNFLKIGHLCEIYHLPLSAHTAPSLHAPLCCALIPAMNVEYFYDHARIEKMIFDGAIQPVDGSLKPDLSQPGLGLELKRTDAAKFEVFAGMLP